MLTKDEVSLLLDALALLSLNSSVPFDVERYTPLNEKLLRMLEEADKPKRMFEFNPPEHVVQQYWRAIEQYAEPSNEEQELQTYTELSRRRDDLLAYHSYFQVLKQVLSDWSMPDAQYKLTEIACIGKCRLYYDGGWGDESLSEVIENPMWIDMYALADQAIRLSGDNHHIFIEDIAAKGMDPNDPEVKIYELSTGS